MMMGWLDEQKTGWPDDWMTGSFADDWPYGIFKYKIVCGSSWRLHICVIVWIWSGGKCVLTTKLTAANVNIKIKYFPPTIHANVDLCARVDITRLFVFVRWWSVNYYVHELGFADFFAKFWLRGVLFDVLI